MLQSSGAVSGQDMQKVVGQAAVVQAQVTQVSEAGQEVSESFAGKHSLSRAEECVNVKVDDSRTAVLCHSAQQLTAFTQT